MTAGRPDRILLLGAFPPQTQGIPGYCGTLARALAARGPVHALGFKAMYPRGLFPGVRQTMDPSSAVPRAENLVVRHVLAWYNPAGWLWHALAVPADIVHLQWWSLPLFPVCLTFAVAAKLRRKPLVVTAHNVLPHESGPGFICASRILYHLADHLIVHSESNRDRLLSHYRIAPGRVSSIPMAVDAPVLAPRDREKARARLGIAAGRPTLLFFGILRPYKGLDILLEALARVRDDSPEVLLLIAGKPWESWDRYQAIIEANDLHENVRARLEYIPEAEVPVYFGAADLVVLPYTHFDAQSAVGAQVLASGIPLLVTDTGGLPALVDYDPRRIAPAKDAGALAERIGAALADPAGMAEAVVAHARTPEATAAAHWAVYRRLD